MDVERHMRGEAMDIEELHQLFRRVHLSTVSTNDVMWFLRMGLPITAVTEFEATPLHIAALCKDSSPDVIKYLLDNGASVHARDEDGDFPLHYLVQSNNRHAVDIAVLLLDHGADINAVNEKYRTALSYAVSNKDIVKLLIDCGANINLLDNVYNSPLIYALHKNAGDIAKLLLDRGANINEGVNHKTLLHLAATVCNPNIVKLLLKYGLQLNVLDFKNWSPLCFSARCNKIEVSKVLLDSGALVLCGASPLKLAIYRYNMWKNEDTLEIVQLLLKYTLLEVAACDKMIINSWVLPVEVIDYGEKCQQETSKMHSVFVDHTTTLAQFIFRLRWQMKHKSKDDITCISDNLLNLISSNAYPLYSEVIFGLLKRKYLIDKLEHMVYAVSNQHDTLSSFQNRVVLHYDMLCMLARYLSKVDLLNLVLAFYNS